MVAYSVFLEDFFSSKNLIHTSAQLGVMLSDSGGGGLLLSDSGGVVDCSYLQDCHQLAHSKNTLLHNVNSLKEVSVSQCRVQVEIQFDSEREGTLESRCACLPIN